METRATSVLQGLDGQSSFSWEWLSGPERPVPTAKAEVAPPAPVVIEPAVRLRPSGLAERLWA